MAVGPLVVELVGVFALTVFLLHKYGDWRRQHLIVSVSTFIGWYFCFIIVFVLSLDVSLTFYRQCLLGVQSESTAGSVTVAADSAPRNDSADERRPNATTCVQPSSFVADALLLNLWSVVYWTSQLLTWLVLPMMQSYSNAGEFSVTGKLRTVIYENAIFYGTYLMLFGALLVYVAAKHLPLNSESLKVILITASNTWGLFLLVLLLGYGLVEVPRQIWQLGHKGHRLQKTYFDIEKLSADKNDADEAAREAYRDAVDVRESLPASHPLRRCADIIVGKASCEGECDVISRAFQFPPALSAEFARRRRGVGAALDESEAANACAANERSLARLHKRAIVALQAYHRTQAQWRALVGRALHLEEVQKNEQNNTGTRRFLRSYRDDRSLLERTFCTPLVEWYWQCVMRGPVLRVLAAAAAAMSAAIVWSECTFFSVHPKLSIAAILVSAAASNYNYGYIELASIIVITYLCLCAYYTVFKVRIYRYYHLDPHHQTDENSLLFSAILLCRLTPPLCLNFLGMIHLDSHVTSDAGRAETFFTQTMGHMDVIGVVANGFNIYLPIAILLLCLGTYFRAGTRLLHALGIDQFIGDDDMTVEMVQGGKALVAIERNRQQREMSRESRDAFWQAKLGADYEASRPLRRGASPPRADDRQPILADVDEPEDVSDRVDWPTHYSSPEEPPKGIFDDL